MFRDKGVRFAAGTERITVPLLEPTFGDLVQCDLLLDQADTPFARRSLVRAAFAFIESYNSWLREQTRGWLLSPITSIVQHRCIKVAILDERVYRPDRQGNLCDDVNRTPFLNMIAFTLRCAAECWGLALPSFFGDAESQAIERAIRVRDRLMHPKQEGDLTVSDDEELAVREAVRWYLNQVVAIVNAK